MTRYLSEQSLQCCLTSHIHVWSHVFRMIRHLSGFVWLMLLLITESYSQVTQSPGMFDDSRMSDYYSILGLCRWVVTHGSFVIVSDETFWTQDSDLCIQERETGPDPGECDHPVTWVILIIIIIIIIIVLLLVIIIIVPFFLWIYFTHCEDTSDFFEEGFHMLCFFRFFCFF